jgi:DNA-binding response OmpR family regulator
MAEHICSCCGTDLTDQQVFVYKHLKINVFGDFYYHGYKIELTQQQMRIAAALMRAQGDWVLFEALRNRLYPDDDVKAEQVSQNHISVVICRINQKCEAINLPRIIKCGGAGKGNVGRARILL